MSRKERIEEILQILREKKGKAEFGFVFSRMFEKYGLTKNTFDSYLDDLKTAGKIDYPFAVLIGHENSMPISLIEKKE